MNKFLQFLLSTYLSIRLAPLIIGTFLGLMFLFVFILLAFVNYTVRNWGW